MTIQHNQLAIIDDMLTKKSIKFLNMSNLPDNVVLEGSKKILMDGAGKVREMIAGGGSVRHQALLQLGGMPLEFPRNFSRGTVQKNSESPEEKLHNFLQSWVLHLFHHPYFRNSLIEQGHGWK